MTQADSDAIARELIELGEEPLSSEERTLLASETLDDDDPIAAVPAVAAVARLHELAEPLGFDDLSELERQRGWREIEGRLAQPEAASHHEHDGTHAGGGAGRSRLLFAAIGLAAAAAVALLVLRPGSEQGPSAEDVADVGAQARTMLEALDDGRSDSERAEALAAEYAQRMATAPSQALKPAPEGGAG